MPEVLRELVEKWKETPPYLDVEAKYWVPNEPMVERCPTGCELEVAEATATGWERISMRDAYRQTKVCREHGFARIYVITGPTAMEHGWKP